MARLAALLPLLLAVPAWAEPVPARQDELLHLLKQDCGSCHGLTMRGGLGNPLLPATLAERDDATLVATILDGRPGTPMPPWRRFIDQPEAVWLVQRLRSGDAIHVP